MIVAGSSVNARQRHERYGSRRIVTIFTSVHSIRWEGRGQTFRLWSIAMLRCLKINISMYSFGRWGGGGGVTKKSRPVYTLDNVYNYGPSLRQRYEHQS